MKFNSNVLIAYIFTNIQNQYFFRNKYKFNMLFVYMFIRCLVVNCIDKSHK